MTGVLVALGMGAAILGVFAIVVGGSASYPERVTVPTNRGRAMAEMNAYEIGEDGGRWLVVGQHEVHRETISVAEARLAVVSLLREQLIPVDEAQFASEVLDALDAPAHVHEYPIYSDPDTELVYSRSPIGGTPIWGDRIGTCAVALGFALPDHRSVRREIEKTESGE